MPAAAIATMTPDRMIVANLEWMPPGWNTSKYKDSRTRAMQYRLNDKATEKKLKSFAILKDMYVYDMKLDLSHTIQFSTGCYLTTVVPLLELYKDLVGKEVSRIALNDGIIDIEVTNIDKKIDKNDTVVEHIVRLIAGGKNVTVTFYDTTCSLRIQGNHDEQVRYTTKLLIPHLEDQVSKNAKQSKTYNDRMLAYKVSQEKSDAAASTQLQVEVELEVVGSLGSSLTEVVGSSGSSLPSQSSPTTAPPAQMLELQHGHASQGLDTPNANAPSTPARPVVALPQHQPALRSSPPPPPPPSVTLPEVDAEDSVLMEDDDNQKKIAVTMLAEKVKAAETEDDILQKAEDVNQKKITEFFKTKLKETKKVKVAEEEIEVIAEDFVCGLCDRSFASKDDLKPHEIEHGDLTMVRMMRRIIALEEQVAKLSKAAPPPICSAALSFIRSSPTPPSYAAVTSATSQPMIAEKFKKFKPVPRSKGKIDIQLFADSISSNIVGPMIEKASGSMLHTTKAYAAQADEVAKFQNKVVAKVVRRHQRPVHTAIIGAASVDITNQSTDGGVQDENVATTVASSHSIVESAEFLIKSGKAKQVILMEHTPRYDDNAKADLTTLANKTLHTARNASEFAENILVGSHTGLDVTGEERRRRFTNDGSNSHSKHVRSGANDQLHMYSQSGALAITKSLTNILAQAGLVKERIPFVKQSRPLTSTSPYDWQEPPPQRGFQSQGRAFTQNQSNDFQIPTYNRFQGFW